MVQGMKSAFKLAQIQALPKTSDIQTIQKILEQKGDINFSIPHDSPRSDVIGYTALHFACSKDDINLFKKLLSHGADFTKTNGNGHTVLHKLIEKTTIKQPLDNVFIDSVFQTHVTSKNFLNPCNNDGLSHFHIACVTNNSAAVQFFLENGVSSDDSVSMDSKVFPGYTPLHFAAMSTNVKIAELLLVHGANMNVVDARKMTPLHVLIERKLEMYDSVHTSIHQKSDSCKKLQKQIEENEKIINMLLENMSIDIDCPDTIGLTNFHVACMLQDKSTAQQLVDRVTDLDHCIDLNSPLWSGYTALHFAAHVSIDTVEMLISNGANLASKTPNDLTPLDICIERYTIEEVCDIIFLDRNWRNILFSDGKTKMLSFIRTFANENYFKKFLNRSIRDINMHIPMESALWPGYTLLHLAVLFAGAKKMCYADHETTEQEIIKICLKKNADLRVQDKYGRTALHLAFRLDKMRIVDAIIQHCSEIPNVSDDENLSHLHIGCVACKSTHLFKKCVLDREVVNAVYRGTSVVNKIRPGSTPLHACLHTHSELHYKVKVLLESGADPYIKDASGLTPTHRLLERSAGYWSYRADTNPLLTKVSRDCVAEDYGLSHLHVACELQNWTAVKRFLKNGANINLAIKYPRQNADDCLEFLSRYDKCTPLLMTQSNDSLIYEYLLKRGAGLFDKKVDGSTPLNNPRVLALFMTKLKKNVDLQKRMKQEFGWTRLHLACHLLEVDGFEDTVKAELADVNAQVSTDSPIWKGYTPLHLLVHHALRHESSARTKAYDASKILLENGADVTLTALVDKQQNTPISMLLTSSATDEKIYEQAALLIKYYKKFDVNPVIAQRMSHFHLACYLNDVDAVKEFLLHGVDVNQPIDFFSDWRPGHTPLHLASQLQIVDLLISHGADIRREDARGCSVLTEVLCRDVLNEKLLLKLIESGANTDSPNARGQSPFEIVISKGPITMEKLMFCIEQDFLVNCCNSISGIGYIAIILDTYYEDKSLKMRIAETIINETSATILGRTTFHHVVTGSQSILSNNDYMNLFGKLIKFGIDVNKQDDKGKTALHLAVEFLNREAICGLLWAGADLNCLDENGKTALSCVASKQSNIISYYGHDRVRNTLIGHICKLDFLKLDLHESNATAIMGININNYCNKLFLEQIAKSKSTEIGVRSLRLYNFLSETGTVLLYSSLNQSEREKIDRYFASINDDKNWEQIQGFLNLQYRKAVKRIELLSSATDSFRSLLGFDVPYLCTKNIFQYLCNSSLKNIIHAETKNDDMKMDVD